MNDIEDLHVGCTRKTGTAGRLQMTMQHVTGRLQDCALCVHPCADSIVDARTHHSSGDADILEYSEQAFLKAIDPESGTCCG